MKNENKKQGFTLAEVLITIGIMMAIMLIGFTGYLSWMNNSSFKYNNENAQAFFAQLQVKLSSERSHGNLNELADKLEKYADSDSEHCGILSDSILNSLKTDGENGESLTLYTNGYRDVYTGCKGKVGPIYYLLCTNDDYLSYLDGNSKGAVKLLYDMLSENILATDQDLLHGDLCVELDPSEGLVYSVFYRSEASKNYAEISEKLDYTNDTLKNRDYNSRKQYLLGYYGVTKLSRSN